MFWPCETKTSTCRNFATISSGLYRFLAIAVLLDVKDIPQVGPLQWGFRDEAIELFLVPYKVRALHGARIAVVLKRTGVPSDDIVEVRTQAIVPFLGRMAGPACVVECLLPRLGVGALTRRLLGHGRENQKHQECCADQSRDCGAGHKRASPHGSPFSGLGAAHYHAVASERRCASQQKLCADVADGVKTGKAQNERMFSGLAPIADMRDGMPDFRPVRSHAEL